MPVYCYFDEDYDKRLGGHVDPSRTTLMKEPFRSSLTNPHLSRLSQYSQDGPELNNPELQPLRRKINITCESTMQGINLIRQCMICDPTKPLDAMNLTLVQDPSLLSMAYPQDDHEFPPLIDENGQATAAFLMVLDRLSRCIEEEKEQAREVGRKEGLMAGIDLYDKWAKDHSFPIQEEVKRVKFNDYSQKYEGPVLMGGIKVNRDSVTKDALDFLNEQWKWEDQQKGH